MTDRELAEIFIRNTAKSCVKKNADGSIDEQKTVDAIEKALTDFCTQADDEA